MFVRKFKLKNWTNKTFNVESTAELRVWCVNILCRVLADRNKKKYIDLRRLAKTWGCNVSGNSYHNARKRGSEPPRGGGWSCSDCFNILQHPSTGRSANCILKFVFQIFISLVCILILWEISVTVALGLVIVSFATSTVKSSHKAQRLTIECRRDSVISDDCRLVFAALLQVNGI